jgi:hypothetical protein
MRRLVGLALVAALALAGLWFVRSRPGARTATVFSQSATDPVVDRELVSPRDEEVVGGRRETILESVDRETGAELPDLPLASTIVGQVFDADGGRIRNPWGVAHGERDPPFRGWTEEGSYRISGLGPGTYWVEVGAPGFIASRREVTILGLERTLAVDFTLQRTFDLPVFLLTTDERPLSATEGIGGPPFDILATPGPPGDWWFDEPEPSWPGLGTFERTSDESEGCIGILHLDRAPPVHVSLVYCTRVLETLVVELDDERIVFRLDPGAPRSFQGSLRIRVIEASSSAPLKDVRVEVMGLHCGGDRVTDAEGVTRFDEVLPGLYDLTVRLADGAQHIDEILVQPSVPTEIDVDLPPRVTISGRCTGERFGAASGAPGNRLSLERVEPLTGVVHRGGGAPVFDSQGRFDVQVTCGLYLLEGTLVDARNGSVEGLEIRRSSDVRVNVWLRLVSGSWDGCRYRVLDANGVEMEAGRFVGAEPLLLHLVEGDYRLLVSDFAGAPLLETSFDATRGSVVSVGL